MKNILGRRPLLTLLIGVALGAAATAAATSQPAASEPATAVIADQAGGVIRFVIGGKTVAVLSDVGLSVREGIEYGGTLSDVGYTPEFLSRFEGAANE